MATSESLTSSYLNCGIYAFSQAAKLLKVKAATLRYWIGELKNNRSIIHRQFPDENILSFADVMELHFVKMFRDENVSFQTIRKAADAASKRFGTDYPFTMKRFDTDGRQIFVTLKSKESNREVVEDLERGQLVFGKLIRPFFKKLDYRKTNEVERFWPLQKTGRIVIDPTRKFGEPIDAQTGVPVSAILNAIHAGGGQDEHAVAKWFDIPLDAVRLAIRFERSLAT